MIYAGLDPGIKGGLAFLAPRKMSLTVKEEGIAIPPTEKEVLEWLLMVKARSDEDEQGCFAMIEQVTGYAPGSGGDKGPPGSRMFKLGQSYGMLRAFLVAASIPFEEVSPRKWQKALGITFDKEDTYTQRKRELKQKAESLYPDLKITLANCDALLIATYCKRKHEGSL